MSQDAYYARVDEVTAEVLESLSSLARGVSELLFTGYQAIHEAGDRQLPPEQRTGLTNLSFFYLLATCIDFLFFLHQRHRGVSIYEHELQHIFGVLQGHAERQREELASGTPGLAPEHGESQLPALGPAAFEEEIERLKRRLSQPRWVGRSSRSDGGGPEHADARIGAATRASERSDGGRVRRRRSAPTFRGRAPPR